MAEQRSGGFGGRPGSASQRPTGGDKANAGKKQYFRRKKMCRFCVEKSMAIFNRRAQGTEQEEE